ncbi:MAG: ABC transporter substrate-binding protein [Fibrobacteres bacterium]|nr:ABC transporter substrate-binding protein [Fibrobacterota bacterium]
MPALIGGGFAFNSIIASIIITIVLFTSCSNNTPTKNQGGVISLLPSITETICAIGAEKELVAVSKFCVYPPNVVDSLPKVGDCIHPNFEAILRLRPRLVFLGDMQGEAASRLRNMGIKVVSIRQSSLSDFYKGLDTIGVLLGRKQKCDSLGAAMKSVFDSLSNQWKGTKPVKTLFVVGRNPGTLANIYTMNSQSFISELLKISGGESIFDSVSTVWCKISLEDIMIKNPDVIMETVLMGNGVEGAEIWRQIPSLNAVKNNRLYTIRNDYIFVPGPRMTEIAKLIHSILHK